MLNTSKAEREFEFKAETPSGEGLKKTIEWYLSTKETKETKETKQTRLVHFET